MSLKCIGPMPLSEFVTNFLARGEASSSPPSRQPFKLRTSRGGKRPVLRVDSPGFCTHLTFSSSPGGTGSANVDACSRVYALSRDSSTLPAEFSPPIELVMEYTRSDPFRDPIPTTDRPRFEFQRTSSKAISILQEHGTVITDVLASHPRAFIFSILISDEGARLLRWDRSGIVVTERFDYTSDDSPLLQFLGRFDQMPDEERGHDISFSFPSNDEATTARAAFATSTHFPIPPDAPLRIEAINDRLFGVNSRGYVAVDLRDGSLVWLKDVWRHDTPSFFKEGDIYRRLNEQNVPHVPSLRSAGDVDSQVTRCQDFLDAPWNCAQTDLPTRRHYRLVLSAIGRPLSAFKSTHELSHATAYSKVNVLHGDISAGNILITDDGRGLLIDWDLAFDIAVGRKGSIIGTWSFISGRLMRIEPKETEHLLHDDLESFLHVLVYYLANYRPTGIHCLRYELHKVYYSGLRRNDPDENFIHKVSFFCDALLASTSFEGYLPPPCALLIEQLRLVFWRGVYANSTVTQRARRAALKTLQSSNRVLRLFNSALKKKGWPDDDGSMDVMAALEKAVGIWGVSRVSLGKRSASTAFDGYSESESLVSVKRKCPLSRSMSSSESATSVEGV
ncbi:hypothetical protein OF83DRAFT_1173383 [Amylostereum chailletii]|nr:hypothetical protein OF83DRAFT_1173383 [Amylostereum chailletii]